MGKKSKKKGSSSKKAARKAKQQERREQPLVQPEQPSQQADDGVNNNCDPPQRPDREYFVGDRVWFKDNINCMHDNPNVHRGIIHDIDGDFFLIKPLQSLIDGAHYVHRVPKKIPLNRNTYVFPDFMDLTLRFDVGDKILLGSQGLFEAGMVTRQWGVDVFDIDEPRYNLPSNAVDFMSHYKCAKVFNNGGYDFNVASDNDRLIRVKPTSFRFKVGDAVTINSKKASGGSTAAKNNLQRNDTWTEGKIILVDVCEEGLVYAAYECSFIVAAKTYSCFVNVDDDEHIALVNEDPRKRLFDAIEQDCSRDHFIYLTSHFGIDIMAFENLVLTKAIEFASYNALTWLQHDCNNDVKRVKDEDGNTFLHMIAKSSHAYRFLRKVGEDDYHSYKVGGTRDDGNLDLVVYNKPAMKELNKNGDVWIQPLVDRGDVKALDLLFSPHHGLAWSDSFHHNEVLSSLKVSDDPMIKHIIDTFVSFNAIYQQIGALRETHYNKISERSLLNDKRLAGFGGDKNDARRQAKLMTRFCRDWGGYLKENKYSSYLCIFTDTVVKGRFHFFQLLYEADPAFFHMCDYQAQSRKDEGEFTMKELPTSRREMYTFDRSISTTLFGACVLGSGIGRIHKDDFEAYASDVTKYFLNSMADKCFSLQVYLSGKPDTDHSSSKSRGCAEYRLRLLEDESDIEGRRKILEYLLSHTDVLPDILVPLLHRQCWALRLMVEAKYLELDGLATKERSIVENASKLSFLDSGHIPSNMSIRCCLAFAAVQYDDLQSLGWLCESVGPPLDLVAGWNLLHYCAFMGRLEIVGWLSTQPVWSSLVPHMSTRKDSDGAFAVHIAASCGHLHVCELLIGLEVPLEDQNGKLPEEYAQHSQHEFVRGWTPKRAKPVALMKDVTKLFDMINESKCFEEIRGYILCKGCLDIDTWRDCGCETSGRKLGDVSFQDVISTCCKYSHISLAQWIIIQLHFNYTYPELAQFWGRGPDDLFAQKILQRHELISFAEERGYHDLVVHLQSKWLKHVTCRNPMTHEYVLNPFLDDKERTADVRAAVLRIEALVSVAKQSLRAIEHILRIGGQVDDLIELVGIHSAVSEVMTSETGGPYAGNIHIAKHFGPFDMSQKIHDLEADVILDSIKSYLYPEDGGIRYEEVVHIHLAIEGYTDLLHFCLCNFEGWSAAMELNVVRLASCLGHTSVVEMMLNPNKELVLLSDKKDIYKAAILGAGDGLRYRDLEFLMHMPVSTDILGIGRERKQLSQSAIVEEYFHTSIRRIDCEEYGEKDKMMRESLVIAVINGYVKEIFDSDLDDLRALNTLRFLVDENIYTKDEIIFALELYSPEEDAYELFACFLSLLLSTIEIFEIKPVSHIKHFREIVEVATYGFLGAKNEAELDVFTRFFKSMANAGIDIQRIEKMFEYEPKRAYHTNLIHLQKKQLNDWSRFEVVRNGGSLEDIQHVFDAENLVIKDFRDRGGLLLTHLSAAYDRVDVLEWLIVGKGMDLDAIDAQQRTVLDVAKASKASSATKWIVEFKARKIIGSSLCRNYHRAIYKRRLQQCNNAATLIQSAIRAYNIRKIYANVLTRRMEESQRFTHVWGRAIASIDDYSTPTSWTDMKEQLIDIKVGLNDEMLDDTDQRLSRAVEDAVKEQEEEENNWNEEGIDGAASEVDKLSLDDDIDEELPQNITDSSQWLSFQMTSHVVKFLQQGDKKYRSFFVRRMRQLASGERSRILQKPLKGSKTLIYETYLEQKSGHRILWTEEADTLVIWYIAKHKQVSRLMQLIGDSKSRSARQQLPADLVTDLQNEGLLSPEEPRKEVLLDIFGNVPLKVYDVSFSNINEITRDSWSPQLHLTDEERDIVEADGTVLVLGRSGTGKTVCICNRIECDRQSRVGQDPSFSQLFVARSTRLCRYVAGAVGEDSRTSFCTYSRLLSDIESTLPRLTARNFSPSRKVDFTRFKRDFHNIPSSNEKVSALVLWTVVRTFLKGSIEAFQSPGGILPREDFLEVERLGKNRCRIPAELRGQIYDDFLQYQRFLDDEQLWDDCDRVRHLLHCIKKAREADPDAFGLIQRSKVYVDEVQDYTQLEILLFFYLCGPNGLFLAGDPAQSVVKGTDFRFEEVRSVGHFVGSTIQKPKTVNVNFRSHSGILNCAGGVLDFLFNHFPGSTKQLKKDRGLFQGSRPGVLSGAGVDELNILLGDKLKGAVVLTHDESARHWRRRLNDYKVSLLLTY